MCYLGSAAQCSALQCSAGHACDACMCCGATVQMRRVHSFVTVVQGWRSCCCFAAGCGRRALPRQIVLGYFFTHGTTSKIGRSADVQRAVGGEGVMDEDGDQRMATFCYGGTGLASELRTFSCHFSRVATKRRWAVLGLVRERIDTETICMCLVHFGMCLCCTG
jgi:hypothetical protein